VSPPSLTRPLPSATRSLFFLWRDADAGVRLEITPSLSEIKQSLDGVAEWARPTRAPFSLNWAAMRPTVRKEPKGVVLVIVPFNYPFFLALGPLVRFPPALPAPLSLR